MNKKMLAALSAVLILLSLLSGCGEKEQTAAPTQEPAASAPAENVQPEQPVETAPSESSQPLEIAPVETAESEDPASSQEQTAPAAELTEEDFVINTPNGQIAFDTEIDSVFVILGEDYEYSEAVSCAYDGMDKTFAYENIDIYTWPDGETDRVVEMMFFSDSCSTAREITVGSTLDELVAAYGKGTEVGSMVEYSALGHLISFGITDGVVTDIDLMKDGE